MQWLKAAATPSPPPPPNQIITGNSSTPINAYLFLGYQWMWHQQQRREQWRKEQWWKQRACSSMQQRRRGCSSMQRACVRQQAAAARGMIAMDSRQPACMQQWAVDAVCMQQHAAVAACVRQRARVAGSMIAMGYSDGSGQPVAQLRWAAVVAAAQKTAGWKKDHDEQRLQLLATVG